MSCVSTLGTLYLPLVLLCPSTFFSILIFSSKNHSIFQEWEKLPANVLSVIVIYLHGQYVFLALDELIIVTCLKVY